ncbi:MAG: hypothetical protein R3F61_05330 [Myxococcota bacterium]
MDLLVLFGPPAAGKMTVGRAVCERTPYRLFHNHMTIEPLLGLFSFEEPAFRRLVGSFRRQILDECLAQQAFDLVFTYVWALDEPDEWAFLCSLTDRVAETGGTVRWVELVCDTPERLRRNRTPARLDAKRSKRDLEWSEANLREIDATYRTTSRPGELGAQLGPYLRLDNTHLTPEEAAARIVDAFGLESGA